MSSTRTPQHLGDLTPDPANARAHTPRNIGMIADALHEVGAARSIVIDEDGRVLAGNGTVEAAAQVGIEKVRVVDADGETLIAVRRTGLTEAQKQRLALFDNRTAELADWDPARLAAIVAENDSALDGLFERDELADILASLEPDHAGAEDPGPQIDRAEELREKWQTARGQLWLIGRHRLLCGDATDAGDVARLMGDERAALGLHDPPYGIAILATGVGDGAHHGGMLVRRNHFTRLAGDDAPFDPGHLIGTAETVVIWGANHFAHRLPPSPAWIVWDKRVDLPSNDFSDGEMAWVSAGGSVRIIRHAWMGLIRDSERGERRVHPTQKSAAVQADVIGRYTEQGDLVADWYLGSGTTMVAAEQTGRSCYGMDIEPAYVAVALERLAGMGLEPRLVD